MTKAAREMPLLDTFSGLLLTLTALSGEFPADLLGRLPGADSYKEFAVKQLKREICCGPITVMASVVYASHPPPKNCCWPITPTASIPI